MNRPASKWSRVRLAIVFTCAALAASSRPAFAQEFMQLDVVSPEYTLGGFKYNAPKTDGWRQMANVKSSLSLVYAQQPEPDKIETIFGVAMEAHEVPEGVEIESAAALAATSASQMAEARKADLVARSPVEAVPSIDNLYTYRLLVHAPVAGKPDGYEVYYVMLSPDKKQYLVIQCIAKDQEYGNQLYFQEFYGSLASLRWAPDGANADAPNAEAPKADAPNADAPKADAPKADAPKADAPKADAPNADAPKADAPSADAPSADAPAAGH